MYSKQLRCPLVKCTKKIRGRVCLGKSKALAGKQHTHTQRYVCAEDLPLHSGRVLFRSSPFTKCCPCSGATEVNIVMTSCATCTRDSRKLNAAQNLQPSQIDNRTLILEQFFWWNRDQNEIHV